MSKLEASIFQHYPTTSNTIRHYPTTSNIIQHSVQASPTWCLQICWSNMFASLEQVLRLCKETGGSMDQMKPWNILREMFEYTYSFLSPPSHLNMHDQVILDDVKYMCVTNRSSFNIRTAIIKFFKHLCIYLSATAGWKLNAYLAGWKRLNDYIVHFFHYCFTD